MERMRMPADYFRSLAAIVRIIFTPHPKTVFFFAVFALIPFRTYAASPLDTLQRQHPRLFFPDSDLPAIKQSIATDSFTRKYFQQQREVGEKLLAVPPDIYQIVGEEHTLLATSRDMEGRIFTLAGLYRIPGDTRFADRATNEMLAAAAFPDWYPTHFLDTAEMTATLGLGYDWLYSVLSPTDRATIKNAIITKGIDPWLERIKSGEALHHEHNNWNQVCNGGESVGALAIAEDEPQRAIAILDHAHSPITGIMKLFRRARLRAWNRLRRVRRTRVLLHCRLPHAIHRPHASIRQFRRCPPRCLPLTTVLLFPPPLSPSRLR